jgi:periplasmic protein CpxP/Spy
MRTISRLNTLALGLGLALSIAGSHVAGAQQPDSSRARAGQQDRRGPGARGDRGDRRGGEGFLLRGITLTDAQKTQVQTLREQDRAQMESRRDQFQKEREEVKALRQKGDTAAIRARMTARRAQMDQERDRRAATVRNILTAEQRVTFDKNVAEAKQRDAQRAQRGDDKGGRRGGRKGGRGQSGQQG